MKPLALALLLLATPAHAEDSSIFEGVAPREIGLALHYSHWEGPYSSQGAGGRFRWEPLPWLGVEGTLEVLFTDADGARRIDIPLGSRLMAFWEPTSGFRVHGALGLCAMFSISDGGTTTTASSDDILLGFRLGGGVELDLGGPFSVFLDGGWQRYLGHTRKMSVWSDALEGELVPVDQIAVALGVLLWL